MRRGFFFFLFITSLSFPTLISTSTFIDTLSSSKILRTNQTLESLQGSFVLGFISGTYSNIYLAIWYKNIPDTVVWVANRDNPLQNSTNSFLKITDDGNIVLLNSSSDSNNLVWSSNSSNQTNAKNQVLVLQLLDTGNLVLRETNVNDPTKYLWQSFDYPTDTMLPTMIMGWNFDKKTEKHLTSWKITGQDPSTGDYSYRINFHGLPDVFLRNDDTIIYRSGPWNGERFSGVPEMQLVTDSIVFSFSWNEHGVNYSYSIGNKSIFSRLVVNSDGHAQRLTWVQSSKTWTTFWYSPKDQCDNYKECGPYGVCDSTASPVCECMKGFSPKNEQAWKLRDGSDGCVRDKDLDCESDKFYRMENVKLPETTSVFVNTTMEIDECGKLCHGNCSCTAYANVYVTNGGSGCVMWFGELNDIRNFSDGGQDIFVRLAASELLDNSSSSGGSHKKNPKVEIIGITISVAAVIVLGLCILLYKKRKLLSHRNTDNMDELDLPMFDFNSITIATNNFLEANKLGHGGFGSVYKGMLAEGQEIAVKRLSETSGQGNEEFKNEIKLIAKLQHRNLVRLLGCCIDKDEKLLVYEYMENRSLDSILFDKARKPLLDWKKRFYIICGIARGLLYLHHDSRLRIIHRDLKASNILLDGEMNPKISDFGMARIFAHDQIEAKTSRVVGTYGYMSPEYAMDGNFSVKSDVFSFGVIVLEIISGKKNRGFCYTNEDMNLLKNAWGQWREGNAIELIDSSIGDSYTESEVLRCIHVGLLCVQERAEDRPTMPLVLLMLGSDDALKPEPRSPGFSLGRSNNPPETDSSSSKQDESWSVNKVTVTLLDAR
ncbi:receptor-like serine/threonine-protein kinase SD1-8 [Vicia villosa]|uniref:receptor-like serine/threonine-protein kinase SD1-8 n=1 Tax=Vicia villosa TaxID=3911 RepID=UPI00273B79AA|nr:receptor-like serine/threonine-protein kinase SD1-8 [Vicia villosa]